MDKFKQLKKIALTGKTFQKWWKLTFNPETNAVHFHWRRTTKDIPNNSLITVFDNNDFILHNPDIILRFTPDTARYYQIIPYAVMVEKKRNGIFINKALYQKENAELKFDKNGEWLNPINIPDDTKEKRLQFNRYMLNWEKVLTSVALMAGADPERSKMPYFKISARDVFLNPPTLEIFDFINNYAFTRKTGAAGIRYKIKAYRKKHQDNFYLEYLNGNYPQIDNFGK